MPIPLRRVRHHARVAPATPDHPFKEEIIALKRAQLPLPSAAPLRLGILAVGLTIWIALTMRYAVRHPLPRSEQGVAAGDSLTRRDILILILILAPLATYVVGVLRYDWGLNELSGLFFIAALVIGVVGGLGPSGSTAAYLKGMEGMVGAAILVGCRTWHLGGAHRWPRDRHHRAGTGVTAHREAARAGSGVDGPHWLCCARCSARRSRRNDWHPRGVVAPWDKNGKADRFTALFARPEPRHRCRPSP